MATINYVGAIVDTQVGKLPKVATVGSMKIFSAIRQVSLATTFGTTMEAHYHDVALLTQLLNDAFNSGCILSAQRVNLMAKCAESIFHSVYLLDAGLAVLSASNSYAIIAQCLDSRLNAFFIKVVDVVVLAVPFLRPFLSPFLV